MIVVLFSCFAVEMCRSNNDKPRSTSISNNVISPLYDLYHACILGEGVFAYYDAAQHDECDHADREGAEERES